MTTPSAFVVAVDPALAVAVVVLSARLVVAFSPLVVESNPAWPDVDVLS